jgi:hypothetical protein
MRLRLPEPKAEWFMRAFLGVGPVLIGAMLVDMLLKWSVGLIMWGLALTIFLGILAYSIAYHWMPVCHYCQCLAWKRHSLRFLLRHRPEVSRESLCEHCLREGKNKVVDSFKSRRVVFMYIDDDRYIPPLSPDEPAPRSTNEP